MATHKSMDECLGRCESALDYAQQQYEESAKQEHYNTEGYTDALMRLENSYNELTMMNNSANEQQRDELDRMKVRVQDLQHAMVIRRR